MSAANYERGRPLFKKVKGPNQGDGHRYYAPDLSPLNREGLQSWLGILSMAANYSCQICPLKETSDGQPSCTGVIRDENSLIVAPGSMVIKTTNPPTTSELSLLRRACEPVRTRLFTYRFDKAMTDNSSNLIISSTGEGYYVSANGNGSPEPHFRELFPYMLNRGLTALVNSGYSIKSYPDGQMVLIDKEGRDVSCRDWRTLPFKRIIDHFYLKVFGKELRPPKSLGRAA